MSKFKVTIIFREPSFEMHRNIRPESPFTIDYEMEANTKQEAVRKAKEYFRMVEQESGVHWQRNILSVIAEKEKGRS